MPQEWLPFVEKYGLAIVGLIAVTWALWLHNKASFKFLLTLIGDLTLRIRTLEGDDRKQLIDTCKNCEIAILRSNDLTAAEIASNGRIETVLDRCSTRLEESAKMIERLKRSRNLPPED